MKKKKRQNGFKTEVNSFFESFAQKVAKKSHNQISKPKRKRNRSKQPFVPAYKKCFMHEEQPIYYKRDSTANKIFDLEELKKLDYEDFLSSEYWQKVKRKVKARDNNKCKKCGCTYDLEVHHITYVNHFHELEHLEDLITLCYKCHRLEHKK